MRVGSTRKWRRGQMQRARDRDQRLEAGMSGIALGACICIEIPLDMSIARGQNRRPLLRCRQKHYHPHRRCPVARATPGRDPISEGRFDLIAPLTVAKVAPGLGPSRPCSFHKTAASQEEGFAPNAVVGTRATGASPSSVTVPFSKVFSALLSAAMAIQQTAPFLSRLQAISSV